MEAIVADKSQFDLPYGTNACTSAAVLFARYSLEKAPCKAELLRVLDAAAVIWKKWSQKKTIPGNFQTWKDVVSTFPGILFGVDVVYETNGFMGDNDLNVGEFLLSSIEECIERMSDGRSAVLTSESASYALSCRDGKYYFFDSHGSKRTNGNAYMLRIHSLADLSEFLGSNFSVAEYTMIILEKRPACK